MTGREAWRIRVGDYRIMYVIHDEAFVIVVMSIEDLLGHAIVWVHAGSLMAMSKRGHSECGG